MSPDRGQIKRHRPLLSRWIRGYLERRAGWEPGVRQGLPDPDRGESG